MKPNSIIWWDENVTMCDFLCVFCGAKIQDMNPMIKIYCTETCV